MNCAVRLRSPRAMSLVVFAVALAWKRSTVTYLTGLQTALATVGTHFTVHTVWARLFFLRIGAVPDGVKSPLWQ